MKGESEDKKKVIGENIINIIVTWGSNLIMGFIKSFYSKLSFRVFSMDIKKYLRQCSLELSEENNTLKWIARLIELKII